LKAAKSIGEPDERDQVVSSVAVRLAEVAKYDEARAALREMDDDSYVASALVKISQVATTAGAHEKGTECLAEATRFVGKVERPLDRVHTLMELARTCVEGEEAERLASIFTQALDDTKLITSEFQKVSALLSISDTCAKTKYEMDEESREMLWEIAVL
jgi:predicted negative regulator of RcsB-dependent stress response